MVVVMFNSKELENQNDYHVALLLWSSPLAGIIKRRHWEVMGLTVTLMVVVVVSKVLIPSPSTCIQYINAALQPNTPL